MNNDEINQLELFGYDPKDKENAIEKSKESKKKQAEFKKKVREQKSREEAELAKKKWEEVSQQRIKEQNEIVSEVAQFGRYRIEKNPVELNEHFKDSEIAAAMYFLVQTSSNLVDYNINMADTLNYFNKNGELKIPSEPNKSNIKFSEYDPMNGLPYLYEYSEIEYNKKEKHWEESDPFNLTNFYQSIFNEVIYTAVIDEDILLNSDQYDDEKNLNKNLNRIQLFIKLFYPNQYKIILKSIQEIFVDEKKINIEASKSKNKLQIKINHIMNYHAGDCYDREEVFIEALHQGVIFSALGKFNHRTPKQHHIHLYQKPSIISSAKLDLSMRWNDSRTVNFEKTKGYEDRETVDEFQKRREELINIINEGAFGKFSYSCKKNYFQITWHHPDFFVSNSIDEIQDDSEGIFSDLLNSYEGPRWII